MWNADIYISGIYIYIRYIFIHDMYTQYFRQILGGLAVNDAIVAKRFVIRAGFFQTLPIG